MINWSAIGHLRAGVDSVRSAKGRSFWTMVGIIIGVASVITIVAIGEGIKNQIGGQIHHYGNNVILVRTAQLEAGNGTSKGNYNSLSGLSISGVLTPKDINDVSQVNGVAASAPLTLISGSVKGDHGNYTDGYVIGTSKDLPSLLNQSMAFGNFFGDDVTSNVAVLGQHTAIKLFNENVPLGRSFSFRGQNFIVGGIFNQFNSTPLSQQADFNNAVFIPNDMAESLSNNTAPTYEILARAANTSQTKTVASTISATLNSSHGGQSGFSVLTTSQDLAANNGILDLLTRLIAGVAAISLLVAGIGIMNVMMVSVRERVREIGIRKAVGATNKQILSQFLVESSLLGLVGGILGIVLAFIVNIGVRLSTDMTPAIHWPIVVIAAGLSLLVGVVAGTVPAVKAARKDPIEALRAE